jgi:tryptophanyl-tRNA synthetase
MNPGLTTQPRRRVFAGARPTGRLHLGHYLGILPNFKGLQDEYDCIYCAVDVHALTTLETTQNLAENTRELIMDLLAGGVDPDRGTILFVQSHVPEVMELATFFGMITSLGTLTRVPTFKEQARAHPENVNYGLVGYPVLQAADISLYKGEVIPVGEDQVPHIELAREIVRKFNRTFGELFPEPQAKLTSYPSVRGLDGVQKMSKSLDNHIELASTPEETTARVLTMVTDPQRVRRTDPGRPEVCNVYTFHKSFNPDKVDYVYQQCTTAGYGCVDCKKILAEGINRELAPFRSKRQEIAEKPGLVEDVMTEGATRAKKIATETIHEAKSLMGLTLPNA